MCYVCVCVCFDVLGVFSYFAVCVFVCLFYAICAILRLHQKQATTTFYVCI